MKSEYDVIVVGAGPAGSVAAGTAAGHGLDVLLIEKRQEIGDPVRCAEGISADRLLEFVKADPRWICAEIYGARLYAPDGTKMELSDKRPVGYVLERKIFDRALAGSAASMGAEVRSKTQAISLIKEDGLVCGIRGKHMGEDFEARAKVVVGADGIESRIGKWAGIDTTLKLKDIYSCVQFYVTDIDVDSRYCEFYPGNIHAPGGYAWVFPKGAHEANVGLGILGSRISGKRPIEYLSEFMDRRFPGGKIMDLIVGAALGSDLLPRLSTGGLVLVGDAGRLCDPLTGGGIINGMESGRIAGNVIAEVINSRDVSASALLRYDHEVYRTIGKTIEGNYRAKEKFVNLSDESMNKLFRYFSPLCANIPASMVLREVYGFGDPLLMKLIRPLWHLI